MPSLPSTLALFPPHSFLSRPFVVSLASSSSSQGLRSSRGKTYTNLLLLHKQHAGILLLSAKSNHCCCWVPLCSVKDVDLDLQHSVSLSPSKTCAVTKGCPLVPAGSPSGYRWMGDISPPCSSRGLRVRQEQRMRPCTWLNAALLPLLCRAPPLYPTVPSPPPQHQLKKGKNEKVSTL